jgi:hypothetical protein
MAQLIEELKSLDVRLCGVYLVDSSFVTDSSKFMSGTLSCLSTMMQLEVPHVSLLSKCDLILGGDKLGDHRVDETDEEYEEKLTGYERFLNPDVDALITDLDESLVSKRYQRLNHAVGELISQYNMVNFVPLDITDDSSLSMILQQIDHAIQYGEDLDVNYGDAKEGPGEGDD